MKELSFNVEEKHYDYILMYINYVNNVNKLCK